MKIDQHTAGPLSDQQLQQWETDGYLLLRNIVPQELIARMLEMYDQVTGGFIAQLKAQGKIEDERKDLPVETRFATVAGEHAGQFGRSWRKVLAYPCIYDLHHVKALVDVIAQLTETDVIGHPVFNGRPKLPNQQLTVVPWHQDSAYFGPETASSLIITCWVPVVPATVENGCMQVLAGSQKMGLVNHQQEKREGQFLELEDGLLDEERAVSCPMEPGDVLLLHNLTFHRSLPNLSSIIRWSVDIRFVRDGDDPGHNYWVDPQDKWVIRSERKAVTPLEQWEQMVAQFPW